MAALEESRVFDGGQLLLVFLVDLVFGHCLGRVLLVVDLVVAVLFGCFELLFVSSEHYVAVAEPEC